jgi:hypothetical protein
MFKHDERSSNITSTNGQGMKRRAFRQTLLAALLGCGGGAHPTHPTLPPEPPLPPPPLPVVDVRLGDIVVAFLPAPFYSFEYDSSGRIAIASFASGLFTYEVLYDGPRIAAMQGTLFPRERLEYAYDVLGRASQVSYVDASGAVYVRLHLAYAGDHLVRLERERLIGGSFLADKRMSFVYDASGNLTELTNQRLPFPGQTETVVVDRFERYDEGINVDGFSLIHDEYFDHLVLLPGVRFQLGNPARVIRGGTVPGYSIDFRYTYDERNRPLTKQGDGVFLSGAPAGSRFQTHESFTYR